MMFRSILVRILNMDMELLKGSFGVGMMAFMIIWTVSRWMHQRQSSIPHKSGLPFFGETFAFVSNARGFVRKRFRALNTSIFSSNVLGKQSSLSDRRHRQRRYSCQHRGILVLGLPKIFDLPSLKALYPTFSRPSNM